MSHSIVMGSLSNFFLSIGRSWRGESHDFESGGQMFVILGVALVLSDTIKFNPSSLNDNDFTVNNMFYYNRSLIERIAFDLVRQWLFRPVLQWAILWLNFRNLHQTSKAIFHLSFLCLLSIFMYVSLCVSQVFLYTVAPSISILFGEYGVYFQINILQHSCIWR